MSSAFDTLLEAARYIELQELRLQSLSQEPNINVPSSITFVSSSSAISQPITGINNLRYNNTINNQLPASPQISPIQQTTPNNQIIHRNDFNITNSNIIRIDSRQICEEPYLNGHSIAAPPLVVISTQPPHSQQQQHQIQNNQNSLSPPSQQSSASSSSFEITRSRSSSVSSTNLQHQITPIIGNQLAGINGHVPITNGIYHQSLQSGDDSNQSSLNLSSVSSGYLSGGNSANSSIGGIIASTSGIITSANLNVGTNVQSALLTNGSLPSCSNIIGPEPILGTPQSITTNGRRRTTSTNSNGGTQRSPCILRAGTREVHNKLEKNRRAHLKECFEQLKKQLPLMPEEKKTSNLSILGAAIRYVQTLKRKERELEHEMERLAKEKIAAQQKIMNLKRELTSQWDHIDFSTIIIENDVESIREREAPNDLSIKSASGRRGPRYSSSSSLSSAATSSPCTNPIIATHTSLPTIVTSISPVIATTIQNSTISRNLHRSVNSSSPSNSNITLPLSLTTTKITSNALHHHHHMHLQNQHHNQITEMSMQSFNNANKKSINSAVPTNSMAINLTSDGLSPALIVASNSSVPLSFNSSTSSIANITSNNMSHGQSLQIISTNNSLKELNFKKNGIRVAEIGRQEPTPSLLLNKDLGKVEVLTTKLDTDAPTKVIKLINGSTIALASVDKDNKLIASSQTLTLQQVVGGGGLVVSPIPLLTSQGLRVIGQSSNGLATIELSTPVSQNQSRNLQTHSSCSGITNVSSGINTNSAQLHKLLVSGTNSSGTSTSSITPELARLPGGAELNILPANTNGATTFYRNQKLAIANNILTLKGDPHHNTSSRAVHVVTPIQSNSTTLSGLTPIVVPQVQGGTNLAQIVAASSSQLSGKMVTHTVGGQSLPLVTTMNPYVVKPMVVAVASSSSTTSSFSKNHPISVTSSNSVHGGNSI